MKAVRRIAPWLGATLLLAGLGQARPAPGDPLEGLGAALSRPGYDAVQVVGDAAAGHGLAWQLGNAELGMRTRLSAQGIRVEALDGSQSWKWGLSLVAWGRTGRTVPVTATEPIALGCLVEYRRGAIVEWYLNEPRGLEQGFTLLAPPDGERALPVELALEVCGGLAGEVDADGRGVVFRECADAVLHYAGLAAWDARGRELAARMVVRGEHLSIVVDDAGAAYPLTVDPLAVTERKKLSGSDTWDNDYFGQALAVDGNLLVVGAPAAGTFDLGEAYVFRKGANASTWTQEAILGPGSGVGANAKFGAAVDVDAANQRVVVGAPFADYSGGPSDAGVAYVFVNGATGWTQQHILEATDKANGDQFGCAVGISGDLALVGASGHYTGTSGTVRTGTVYLFKRNGSAWEEASPHLVPTDVAHNDRFGSALSIDGSYFVVGAPEHDYANVKTDAGTAYAYLWNGSSATQQQKLSAGDGVAGDQFGGAVALDGATIAVGAKYKEVVNKSNGGAAYAFVRSGTTWSEQDEFWAYDANNNEQFGCSLGLKGDVLVVGAHQKDHGNLTDPGAVYVFTRGGNVWTDHQTYFAASDAQSYAFFGTAVGACADLFMVGAPRQDLSSPARSDAGQAYVFQFALPAGYSYCTAGTTTHGCAALMSVSGKCSGTAANGSQFWLTATNVEGWQSGIVFYGVSGQIAAPWGTSFMCVKAPVDRMGVQSSGGTPGGCDGVLSVDWNQYVVTHPGAVGTPFLGGETVYAQAWFRDPPAMKTTNLSNAIWFVVGP